MVPSFYFKCLCTVTFLILLSTQAGAWICEVYTSEKPFSGAVARSIDGESLYTIHLDCPQRHLPDEYLYCCYEKINNQTDFDIPDTIQGKYHLARCCDRETFMTLHDNDSNVTIIVSVTLLVVVFIVTVVILVCCFWSRCPLYMFCRVKYRQDDVVAYACVDEEISHLYEMPPEEMKGVNIYSPNPVKITARPDD